MLASQSSVVSNCKFLTGVQIHKIINMVIVVVKNAHVN